jgi:hypothetical protein
MKQSNWLQKLKHRNKDKAVIPDHYWSAVKNEDYGDSYPKIEAWLREISLKKSLKQERKFSSMRTYIMAHKMRLVYTVIVLAVLIGACSMPVTQHETVGHILTWTVPVNPDVTQKINSFSWIDKSKLTVNENTNNGNIEVLYKLFLPNTTREQVETYMKELESIKELTTIRVFPLNEDVKRPLFSAALYNFFRINLDATKMSDKELEQELTKQMKEAGFEVPIVEFTTDENGKRMFKVQLENHDKTNNEPKNFELNVNDGNNKEVLKFSTKPLDKEKLKDMTDEQIRQYIKEQHKEIPLDDKDIQIERINGDVKVKVQKEDGKRKIETEIKEK